MLAKSKGIVLSHIKYGDTSIIARILTESFGYGSFIINSIRSQKSKRSMGHFQPFSVLDMVIYHRDNRNLQRIAEYKNHFPLHTTHTNLTKSTIVLFLSEVLSRLLVTEQVPNPDLYSFTESSIKSFDTLSQGVSNFHIQFLLKLASHLGFEIEQTENLFSSTNKLSPENHSAKMLERMLQDPFGSQYGFNRDTRNEMLEIILEFYQHHAGIQWPKSLEILRSVLN